MVWVVVMDLGDQVMNIGTEPTDQPNIFMVWHGTDMIGYLERQDKITRGNYKHVGSSSIWICDAGKYLTRKAALEAMKHERETQ